jgi:hypothetical protein
MQYNAFSVVRTSRTTGHPSYNGPSITQYHHPSFTINIVIVTNFSLRLFFWDRDRISHNSGISGAGAAATFGLRQLRGLANVLFWVWKRHDRA